MNRAAALADFDLIDVGAPGPMVDAPRRSARSPLRRMLIATDVAATSVSWLLVLGFRGPGGGVAAGRMALIAGITAVTVAVLASQQLYLARVCRVRAVEVSRLARASAMVGAAVYLAAGRLPFELGAAPAARGALVSFFVLALARSAYTSWLRSRRLQGLSSRPVVIVGDNEEAIQLQRLFDGHLELGFLPVAMVSRPAEVAPALARHGADAVVVAVSAMDRSSLNSMTRTLLDAGVHVHLSCGLAGIDHRRLRPTPMAHEPLFYVEPPTTSAWQRVASRSLDIVGSLVGLVLSLPVLVAAAIAIKLHDRGPVIFSHERIGQDGRPFMLHKLRTMVPNAESCLPLAESGNRRDGPLFKSDNDPRVTPVGRLLRASSIDELPQLMNVLKGTMSLVGPRPALAREVAQFDAQLLARHRVRPGITGLWQVEARNDPSFDSYRRLDLFYLENWSLMLDVVILLGTVKGLLGQAMNDLKGHWRVPQVSAGESLELVEPNLSPGPVPAR